MTLAKFRCASWSGSGDHIVVCFRSTLVVFIFFCLMNLVMISQTAQWRIFEFEVGERSLASGNERLTVFCLLSSCSSVWFDYTRCIEKSHFGAVTFGKRVVLFIHVQKNLSELKSGKECNGLHSLAELIFDGMIVVFIGFCSEAFFVFLPFKKT